MGNRTAFPAPADKGTPTRQKILSGFVLMVSLAPSEQTLCNKQEL